MTKKDFIAIAAIINEAQAKGYSVEWIARELATVCAGKNPAFNRAKFLAACGTEK